MNRREMITIVACVIFYAGGPSAVKSDDLLAVDRSIPEVVDHYVNLKLSQQGVAAAPPCVETNLIRRTMLDLVGRIPTLNEAKQYLDSPEPNKRQLLIAQLIASPAFVRHQTNELNTLLMYDSGRDLRAYLERAVTENRPWDVMFREMIAGDQSDDQQRAATEFVRARAHDLDKLANEASVIFFGVNVSCAKCHDHPLVSSWTQEHYFGMKSFFSRTFENGDFLGEHDYGIVKYKTTKDEEHTARLMFLSGNVVEEPESKEPSDDDKKAQKEKLEELKKNKQPPPPPGFSRRAQLVDVALRPNENQFFAKSIVNRMWHRLYGHGLVMPIDQMHPENAPSHPELLDWLARDLITHNYDLRRVIQGLVSSNAYARSSRWDSEERPSANLFAVANVRPLSPSQYAAALRFASTNPDTFDSQMKPDDLEKQVAGVENAARGLANSFEQPIGDFQVSVTEALLLSNDERIMRDLVRDADDSLIGKLKTIEDDNETVQTAIWNVFGRAPDEAETASLAQYLNERQDRRLDAIQQMVWALLASSECRFNY